MKVFFIILIFSLNFGFNAFADDSDIQKAPQDIIRTLAKVTNNFTNSDGSQMKIGDSSIDAIILEKLKDPQFRKKFIDETLKMHQELSEQLIKDLNEIVKNGTNNWSYVAKKSGKFGVVEYSKRRPYDDLFENLHLLNLMIASAGYMTDFDEKSNFRNKIIHELSLSEFYKTEINKLKKILIEKEVSRQGMNLLETSSKKVTEEKFKKWTKETSESVFNRTKVTMTLLQSELSKFPIWEARTFQMYLNKKDSEQYNVKLEYAKKATYERINLINMALEAHLLPVSAQNALTEVWISNAPMSDMNPGAEKWVLRDTKVQNALNGLFARLSSTHAATELENVLFKERESSATPTVCSNLFN